MLLLNITLTGKTGRKWASFSAAPSPAHLAALSVVVIELAKEQGITDDDLKVRQEIVEEMSKVITTFLPGTTSFYT